MMRMRHRGPDESHERQCVRVTVCKSSLPSGSGSTLRWPAGSSSLSPALFRAIRRSAASVISTRCNAPLKCASEEEEQGESLLKILRGKPAEMRR